MGSQFKGKRPQNNVTISTSAVPRKLDVETGRSTTSGNRSFAQPSPVAPPKEVTPKAHASKEAEAEALKRNSTKSDQVAEDKDAATGEE